MKKIILLSTLLVASAAWAAGNGQHNMSEHITSSSPASQEYLDGMQKMHDGMMKARLKWRKRS